MTLHPTGLRAHELAPRDDGLIRLREEARRDLDRLNYPPANWPLGAEGPDGRPLLDVLIVGAGMCGQTAAFALIREGVRNIRVVDRAARGREGPWGTFARMETLRSPKHLTGPDLGVPSLTYRAWHEAQHGPEGWESLYKIGRLEWRDYLLWVRDTIGLAVENESALVALEPRADWVTAELVGPQGREVVHSRHVVLASGRDGAGASHIPPFPSIRGAPEEAAGRVFHSSDDIDFSRFGGGRLAVLGASASAFDNAGAALEAGATEMVMFCRRPYLPQVNKSRGLGFLGYQRGFARLDDATRWRFLAYMAEESAPPPHESVLRCQRHPGFSLRFGESWRDVVPEVEGVTVVTETERFAFDGVIFATGFSVDLGRRAELAGLEDAVMLWGDRVPSAEASRHPDLARFPYLGLGFELMERTPGARPGLSRIRLFNHGATASQSALAGDIPGLGVGADRVARSVAHALFQEDLDRHYDALTAFEEPELEPTPYFVPRNRRGR